MPDSLRERDSLAAGFDRAVLEQQEREERERKEKRDRKRDKRVSRSLRAWTVAHSMSWGL